MTFLYDFVCDNRMVCGAREVKEISIRHTKNAPERFVCSPSSAPMPKRL
jgi:hypothetical protein